MEYGPTSHNKWYVKNKTWDDIEKDEPTPDEIAAFEEYCASKRT